MRRRLLFFATGLAALLGGLSCSSPGERRPHVFVFLVDTLRADHVGVYGYHRATTPQLDAFAQDAVVFARAYSASPWTRPSIASLFTGLPPNVHGVRGRDGWLAPEALTWAEALAARGYRTSAWYTNGNLQPHFGLDQGFADYSFEEEPAKAYLDGLSLVARWTTALDRRPADTPLFQYLHLMEPHIPFRPLRQYRIPFVRLPVAWKTWFDGDRSQGEMIERDVNNYDAEILQADDAFGRFLTALRERGLYEDSWIVFLSDHGEEFHEHGHRGHGAGLWENLLRVPLVVRPPGGRAGTEFARLGQLSDAPVPLHALADLIGAAHWKDWTGLGRANLDSLGLAAWVPEAWIPVPGALAPPLRRASFTLDGRAATMVSRDEDKLIWNELPEAGWRASDLAADPRERNDSGRRTPELVAELEAAALAGWRGLRLSYGGPDTLRIDLQSTPPEALREARVPVGLVPSGVELIREPENRHLRWTAVAGRAVVLRTSSAGPLRWRFPGGTWAEADSAALAGLQISVERAGPPEDPAHSAAGPLDPELEEKLRALGYLN